MESRLQEMEARRVPLKVKVDQREAGFVWSLGCRRWRRG